MLASQAAAMELWMAAARQCSLHSTGCSLHFTQQWRKGSMRFQQHIPRANQPDGSCNESKVRRSNRRSLNAVGRHEFYAQCIVCCSPMGFDCNCHPDSMACDQQSAALVQEQHSHQEIAEELLKLDPASQERCVSLNGMLDSILCLVSMACPSHPIKSPRRSRLHPAPYA